MQLGSTTNDEDARLACYWAIERAFSRESAMALRATTGDENAGRESVPWR